MGILLKKINISKITSKYQATIPKEIRRALGLHSGDTIAFQITESGTVIVRKSKPLDMVYIQALNDTLSEWKSEEDEESYRHLQNL